MTCLWNAEVKLILEHQLGKNRSREDGEATVSPNDKMIRDCLNYVTEFNSYSNKEAVRDAKEAIKKYQEDTENPVHEFEIACLNNLNIEDVDEARALIPTLADKFEDPDDLQKLLNDLKLYQTA